MRPPHSRPLSARRLLLLGGVFALSVLSCGREPTGPGGSGGTRWSRALAWNAQFPAGFAEYQSALQASPQSVPNGAGALVAFTKVRIVLNFPDGSLALDTVVTFPAGADEIPVTLNIPLPASAPSGGIPLSMKLKYVNAAGDTVFSGGPVGVTAVPATPGAGPPPPSPVNVPLSYTGPGSVTATQVRINPKTLTANTGQAFNFTAQALDAAGNVVTGVPIIFTSQNPVFASVNAATGAGTAGPSRGTVNIVAQLLTGPADAATLTIVAPPASLAAVGPATRDGAVGANVTPVVVQANATDGLPAPGVTVTFAAQNGGSVGSATVVTGANGQATTTWRLGSVAGTQTLTASANGLSGSPVTFTATARAVEPVRLEFAQQPPASTAAGSSLTPAVTVRAVDATGAVTTNFTGPVSVALGAGAPAGSALTGTVSVNAVAGIASFGDLKINLPGTYTLVASSGTLTGATSSSFQIVAGNANRLAFQGYPVAGAVAGAAMDAITVVVRDALGNANTTFSGPVTLTANGPTVATGANATDVADTAIAATSDVVLSTPLTVNAVAGVATFTNVQLNAAGSYTLTASSPGLTSATGPSFAITAGPASTLVLVSGGGQSAPGAAALANPVVVKVTDAVGNGIVGKTVNFTPAVGSGTANPTTAVTDAGGLAQTTWTIGAAAGPMTLNVTGTGLTPNPLAVTATATTTSGPGPATQLAFTTQPSNRTAGAVMVPAVVVTAKDALGAVATSFNGNVTLSILNNVGSSTLLGTTTVAASAGVATFGNVSLTNIGVGYTLQAVASGLTSATSSAFNITAAGAATIVADSGVGQAGTAGGALPQAFTVYVADGFGNPVAGAPVTWNVTGGGGSLSGVTSVTNANGRARAVLTLGAVAGSNTVTATSAGLTGSPVTFTATGVAGIGTMLAFSVQPTNAAAGTAIAPAMQVSARDANNNVVTSFTGAVALTFGANPGGAAFTGTTTVNAVAGVATFPGISLDKTGAGYTIVASSAGLTSATSATFDITAGAATQVVITAQPQVAQTAGTSGTAIVVTVKDALGNVATGYGTNVSLSINTGPAGATVIGPTSVAPVAGVATFGGVSFDKAGAYTLTFASGALSSATSNGFTVAAGAAVNIAADSGTGQSGPVGSALTNAFVARVTDNYGNPVAGTSVTFAVTGGGGSVTTTNTTTDVNGRARTTLTLGNVAGTNNNTVTATSGTLTGSPVTFTASANAGAATKLVFLTGPSNVTAGIPISASPVVQAQDALNNPVPSYATAIAMAISTNPGGATLGGTTSETPSSGTATFANLRLNKTGVGYVLTATSGGLTAAVSGTFDVTPAPAQVLSVVSGNAQTALVNVAVPAALVAKVVDSLGNAVPGVAGTWAVATGGGSLSATVSTSNANGEFSTGWTLGALAGPSHSVTLTVGSVTGSPLTFTATASSTAASKVWTGANGTDLADPLNWSPPGAPAATDSLLIQAGGPTPTLSANASFAKVTVAAGATLNLNGFTLTITGNVDAGTTIIGNGSSAVVLSGTGTLKGSIMVPVTITGTYTLSGDATVGRDLNIVNSGSLDIGAFTMTVDSSFSTQNSGTITMTQAGGLLYVGKHASFGGGAETGKLLDGVVQVVGNFSQSGNAYSYQTTGAHQTWLWGGATQSLSFTDLAGNSRFNHLLVNAPGATTATTDFFANSIHVAVGVGTFTGSTAIVRDSITDPNNRWGIPTVRFIGSNIKTGNALGTATVRIGPNTTNLLASVSWGGSVIVDSSGVLVLNGKTLAAAGNFSTAGGGRVNMTNAADVLDVAGSVTFGGGSQAGLLTAGQMQVGGNLTQVNAGSGTEFVAAATHTTILDGTSAQTITFADPDTSVGACAKSCVGSMTVTNTGGAVTFASPAKFTGNVSVGAGVTAFNAIGTAGNPRLVGVSGTFSTAAATPAHVTLLAVGGSYLPGAGTTVDSVIFVGAGQSIPAGTYGEVVVRGSAALAGGITTAGGLTVHAGSLTLNGRRANVQGDFRTENGGTLTMTVAADTLDVTGTITFAGGASAPTNGAILARGDFWQLTTSNAFSATGQHVTRFTGAGNQSVNLATPDYDELPPLASGACQTSCFANVEVSKATGKMIFANHAKMTGSFTVFAATDSITAYNRHIIVGGNFNPSTAPTRMTLLSLGGAIANVATTTVDTLIHWGNTQVTKLPTLDLQVWGSDTISTSATLAGGLRVYGSGEIVFNAPLITISGNFSTNGGTTKFVQKNATDTVRVLGNVTLSGGTSAPTMGRLEVEGDISLGGSNLAASGTHVTALVGNGAGTQTLGYGSPITAQGFRHLHFGGSKTKVINGQVTATGDVELYSSTTQPITGTGATVNIGGNFTDSAHVGGDTIGIWRVDNTTLYGNAMVKVGYMKTNLLVTGTTQFPALPQLQEGGAALQLTNALAFPGTTRVRGNVNVEGASGLLDLSASYLYVYGNFVTANGGRLESNHHIDYLWVSGNATFSGGTSVLTDGTLEVLGNFSQLTSATAFAADTAHNTLVGSFTQVLEELRLSQPSGGPRTRALTPAQLAAREAAHQRFLTRRRAFIARYNAARAAAIATGLPLPRAGTRQVAPGVIQVSNVVSPSTVSFANPGGAGASHFGTWEIAENVVLTSDVNSGVIATYGDGSEVHGSNNLVTSYNASLEDLTFDNVRWFLDIKALPDALDQVTFKNMSANVDQFTVQGDGTIDPPALYYWNFQSAPSTGTYLRAIDTAAGGDPLDIQFTAVQPSGHGGKIALVGEATTNWQSAAVATWTNPHESGSWDDPDAWDIGVVPDSTVDVIIPQSSSSWPGLSANRSVRNLTVQDDGEGSAGDIYLNDFTLTVHGNVDVPSRFGQIFHCGTNGDGTVQLRGAAVVVQGNFCNLTIAAGTVATLGDDIYANRNVLVLGSVILGEFDIEVAQDYLFTTSGSGTVTMTEADGRLIVYDAVFGGGSTAGLLTAGEVIVDGSLTVTAANAYAASGAHTTTLDAMARVTALRETAVRAETPLRAQRNQRRAVTLRARAEARAAREAAVAARARLAGAGAAIRAPAARPAGAPPVNIEASYVDLSFTNTTGNQFAKLALNDYVNITTPVKVAKNAHLSSSAYVEGSGRLIVTDTLFGDQYSSLYTAGVELLGTLLDSGTFSPDTTTWSGTNQYIPAIVQGGYSYLTYNNVIVSGTNARMYSATDYYTINQDLKVIGSGQLRVGDAPTTTVYVYGNFATEGSGTLRMSDHDSTFFNVYGDSVRFGGGSTEGLLTKGTLYVGGMLFQSGDAKAFSADKGHNTAFGGATHLVNFASPGFAASHFGDLIIEDDSLHFETDAFIAGWLHAHSDGYGEIGSSNALITSRGATATRLRFYNTRWKIVPGDSISSTNNVEFLSMTPTATYFTLERNGTGVLPTFDSWVFGTTPTGAGRYVEVNDLLADADVLTFTLSSVTPSVHLGKVNLLGGAQLSGWTSGVAQAVSSGNWTSAATWSGGVRPDSTKHILIPTGVTVTLDTIVQHMRSLTIEGTGTLAQGSNSVYVHGNIAADTLGGITCTTGITYQPDEVVGTVSGRFCRYHSGGVILLAGKMKVDSVWHVHDGTFTFNGNRVDTKQAWIGSGEQGVGAGTIAMSSPGDALYVSDSLLVGDASGSSGSGSAPTNGYIQVSGNFRQVGPLGSAYWSPPGAGNNKVRFTGTGEVTFSDTTASGFARLEVLGNRTFNSVVRVNGALRNGGIITGTNGRIRMASGADLTGSVGSAITIRAFELTGVFADSGGFSPDTAVFKGGPTSPQIIPDTVGTASDINYKSIRIMNDATLLPKSANTGWLINGKVLVDDAILRIGGGATTTVTIADSLHVYSSGRLQMVDAASSVTVQGHARFAGSAQSGYLTAGTLTLLKNFAQTTSSTSFVATGSHTTVFAGSTDTVTFAYPVSSKFNDVHITAGSTIVLGSSMYAAGALSRVGGASNVTLLGAGGSVQNFAVGGLNISGNPTTLNSVSIEFQDGTAFTTFNDVTFAGFNAFTGPAFKVNRSGAQSYTFTNLNFGSVLASLGSGGRLLENTLASNVTLVNPTPSGGLLNVHYSNLGGGTVTWP